MVVDEILDAIERFTVGPSRPHTADAQTIAPMAHRLLDAGPVKHKAYANAE
ncbi:hypothetical protein FHR31_001249 [Parvibacter caecicola]|uniref:Uncharacterized protein n=1 Tax=Parvibacter caecicola TaxID=747645 RepID=A0A7W5D294_9ACTN|nr:hypothetical protein [Parvibacter caecicola]